MNYFDLHCDTPYECYFKNQPFSANNLAVSGEKGAKFESWRQVLDPFMGSGTTIVASKMLDRKSMGIEISREFCELAFNRVLKY